MLQRIIESPLPRVLFWLALAGALTMALLPQPPHLPIDALGDKFEHMLAFAVLTALAATGWPAASRWKLLAWLSLLGAGIEVLQAIPSLHRDSDVRDWIADTLAIGATLLLLRAAGLRRRPA